MPGDRTKVDGDSQVGRGRGGAYGGKGDPCGVVRRVRRAAKKRAAAESEDRVQRVPQGLSRLLRAEVKVSLPVAMAAS